MHTLRKWTAKGVIYGDLNKEENKDPLECWMGGEEEAIHSVQKDLQNFPGSQPGGPEHALFA